MTGRQIGLYEKYAVQRIVSLDSEGDIAEVEPVKEFCFVLKPDSDPIALDALKLYAAMAHLQGYERLADDLMRVVWDIESPEHADGELRETYPSLDPDPSRAWNAGQQEHCPALHTFLLSQPDFQSGQYQVGGSQSILAGFSCDRHIEHSFKRTVYNGQTGVVAKGLVGDESRLHLMDDEKLVRGRIDTRPRIYETCGQCRLRIWQHAGEDYWHHEDVIQATIVGGGGHRPWPEEVKLPGPNEPDGRPPVAPVDPPPAPHQPYA